MAAKERKELKAEQVLFCYLCVLSRQKITTFSRRIYKAQSYVVLTENLQGALRAQDGTEPVPPAQEHTASRLRNDLIFLNGKRKGFSE